MREIKFRVFDNDLKNLPGMCMHVCGEDEHDSIVFFDNIVTYYNLQNGCGSLKDDDGNSTYVLMQYTGLKDKNGVGIYEGDIVKLWMFDYDVCPDNPPATYRGNYEVYFDKNESMYTVRNSNEDFSPNQIGCFKLEVIGNIHQNSELLDEGKEHD
jgi:uncharacterized phage protein (TIGR01671 family)